jgi:hypothetical protein
VLAVRDKFGGSAPDSSVTGEDDQPHPADDGHPFEIECAKRDLMQTFVPG